MPALNTLMLCLGAALLAVPLGLLLAALLCRANVRGRTFFFVSLVALLFVPLSVQCAAWKAVGGPLGWLSELLGFTLLDGWRAAIWIHAVAAVPWTTLITVAALRAAPRESEEQALLDASPSRVFFAVTLRLIAPAIAAAVLWTWITTAGEMTVTNIWQITTIAEQTYLGFALEYELSGLLAFWLPGLLLTLASVAAGLFIVHVLSPLVVTRFIGSEPAIGRGPSGPHDCGHYPRAATIPVAAVMLLLIGVPVAALAVQGGMVVEPTSGGYARRWSPVGLAEVVLTAQLHFREGFLWTFQLAAPTAALVVAAATWMTWSHRRGGRVLLIAVIAVCLAVPGPVIGRLLLALFDLNWPGAGYLLDRTLTAPVAATAVKAFPLAALVVWHGLAHVPRATLEAAELDGAGSFARLLRIALPQCRSAIAMAALLAFAVAAGDLAASILVLPPGVDTLTRRVFGLAHAGVRDRLAGLCLVLMILAGAVAFAASRLWRSVYWSAES